MDELLNFTSEGDHPAASAHAPLGHSLSLQSIRPHRADHHSGMMMVVDDNTHAQVPAPALLGSSLACHSYDSYNSPHRDSRDRDSFGAFIAPHFTPEGASPKRQVSHTIDQGTRVLVPSKYCVVISDFSPTQDHQQGGGTKVLICLENEIPTALLKGPINVSAGYKADHFLIT